MKRQTINEVMGLQAEKRKKSRRRLKRIFAVVKLVLMLSLIISALVFTALSPLFNINAVEVKGALYYNKEALAGISGVITGENGFKKIGSSPLNIIRLRFGAAEKAIMGRCPYIKDVKVRFAIPSTVVISVTERKAFFRVPSDGTSILWSSGKVESDQKKAMLNATEFLLIDKEGYVLEVQEASTKSIYPVLEGLEAGGYKLGEKLDIKNKRALTDAIRMLEAVAENDSSDKADLLGLIDLVNASDPTNIIFSIDSRITVKIGDMGNINYRLSATKTLYNNNIKKSEKGILDFSGKEPVFSPDDRG